MLKLKRWQDAVTLIAGLWMLASPWALAFGAEARPFWNSVIAGILIAALACYAIVQAHAWQEWANGILGAWLIASPAVLGFAALETATLNAVLTGAVVLALALSTLVADKPLGGWWKPALLKRQNA